MELSSPENFFQHQFGRIAQKIFKTKLLRVSYLIVSNPTQLFRTKGNDCCTLILLRWFPDREKYFSQKAAKVLLTT